VSHTPQVARLRAGELGIAGVSLSHPVWDEAAQRWTPVAALSLQSTVIGLLPNSTARTLEISELSLLPSRGPIEVFNLEVDGEEHNYFAEGILVHNKSDDEGGGYHEGGSEPGGGGGGTSSSLGGFSEGGGGAESGGAAPGGALAGGAAPGGASAGGEAPGGAGGAD
jgi:hypothetical protein